MAPAVYPPPKPLLPPATPIERGWMTSWFCGCSVGSRLGVGVAGCRDADPQLQISSKKALLEGDGVSKVYRGPLLRPRARYLPEQPQRALHYQASMSRWALSSPGVGCRLAIDMSVPVRAPSRTRLLAMAWRVMDNSRSVRKNEMFDDEGVPLKTCQPRKYQQKKPKSPHASDDGEDFYFSLRKESSWLDLKRRWHQA